MIETENWTSWFFLQKLTLPTRSAMAKPFQWRFRSTSDSLGSSATVPFLCKVKRSRFHKGQGLEKSKMGGKNQRQGPQDCYSRFLVPKVSKARCPRKQDSKRRGRSRYSSQGSPTYICKGRECGLYESFPATCTDKVLISQGIESSQRGISGSLQSRFLQISFP